MGPRRLGPALVSSADGQAVMEFLMMLGMFIKGLSESLWYHPGGQNAGLGLNHPPSPYALSVAPHLLS